MMPAPKTDLNAHPMANCLRALAMDAVQKANSGHPGMPMGMADVSYILYSEFLKFNPQNPTWPDRDRFVLSAGHGSMLLYGLNYLTGYKGMTLDQLKAFRQLGSHTAGHPEVDHELGIETTTGPLGQGIATSVGMALGEKMMQAHFGKELVDHHTYVIAGDGCLAEGISQEAISFAGHNKLGKLIVLFDDNEITIDGSTELSTSDDQLARFEASNWHVMRIDGHDHDQIRAALKAAKEEDRPSLIACRTTIGFGSPHKSGTSSCHGSPLGEEEIQLTREALGWTAAPFEIPEVLLSQWRSFGEHHQETYQAWQNRLNAKDEKTQNAFSQRADNQLSAGWQEALNDMLTQSIADKTEDATRKLSQKVLNTVAPFMPELVGGSADLTGSNNTQASSQKAVNPSDFSGQYIYYGVREHAMAAIMNGLRLHGGFLPYGGTFLTFTDYARPAIRLSALMEQTVVYVMTHDSIGLGEDGPTHQPIEHLASLRAIPNLNVMRPCDVAETAECWSLALSEPGKPSVISLTRQKIPLLRTEATTENFSARGGYVIREASGDRQVTLIATGSEVHIAVDAQQALEAKGIPTAVVSMPCGEYFDQQPKAYRDEILGKDTVRVAIEAAHPMGWHKYTGDKGAVIGIESFGASAPASELYKHFGITAENIIKTVEGLI